MGVRRRVVLGVVGAVALGVTLHGAAALSRQQADNFAKKVAIILQHGEATEAREARRRTSISEDELNSWFAYRSQPLLPSGVMPPTVRAIGSGKLMAVTTVDLEAVAKQRRSGGVLDPWNVLTGKMPISVTGTLHTRDGRGRFDITAAEISGVPVPKTLLQELVSYYSRKPDDPAGIRLDDPFELPAKIRQIEVGQGQAVVVQ